HSDLGGNAVRMTYYYRPTNLHLAWDQGIPEKHYGWPWALAPDYSFDHDAVRFAARIMDARIDPKDRAAWGKPGLLRTIDSDAIAWSDESHALVPAAYAKAPVNGSGMTEEDYQAYAWPIVERQLQKASVRLGKLLNEILS